MNLIIRFLIGFLFLLLCACGSNKHYDHDIYFCRLFAQAARLKALELQSESVSMDDFKLRAVRDLTYSRPGLDSSVFLILKDRWTPSSDGKKIVIFCTRPRVVKKTTIYAVGYADGSSGWESEQFLYQLKIGSYISMPLIR